MTFTQITESAADVTRVWESLPTDEGRVAQVAEDLLALTAKPFQWSVIDAQGYFLAGGYAATYEEAARRAEWSAVHHFG